MNAIVPSEDIWLELCSQAQKTVLEEPIFAHYLNVFVLANSGLEQSLCTILADKLSVTEIVMGQLFDNFMDVFVDSPGILQTVVRDLIAAKDRDPASHNIMDVYLNHKGFQSLQAYRLAHFFWMQKRYAFSSFLQCRVSEVFAVDIHPAAIIGGGVFIDHGTSLVIGETAVVGDNVSLLQEVTLGGTGKEEGQRHPKIGNGVLVSAGAKVLGNIHVGNDSMIGAGSVVLSDVSPHTTVVGVPAKPVRRKTIGTPALNMDQQLAIDS